MNLPLNILVLEALPTDFELLVRQLQRHGLAVNCQRVANCDELKAALGKHAGDLVLAACNLPGTAFRETLSFLQARHPDLPIILITGSVGEEEAVELLNLGLWDFVLKDRLARLVPAIERCLREADQRRENRRANAELVRLKRLYATLSQVDQCLVRSKSREDLAGEVTRVAVELGGFKLAWIGRYSPQTRELTPLGCAGEPRAFVHSFRHGSDDSEQPGCLCGLALRENRSCVSHDLSVVPERYDWQAAMKRAGVRAAAVFPLRVRGAVWGVFGVYAGEPAVFQDREISLLEQAAADIGYALERLEDEAHHQQAERFQRLASEVLGVLHRPLTLRAACQAILELIKQETGLDAVGIRLKDGEDFPYFGAEGLDPAFLLAEDSLILRTDTGSVCREANGQPCLECTCGLVLAEKCGPPGEQVTAAGSFWTNDSRALAAALVGHDLRLKPRDRCLHEGFLSIALIPLRVDEQVIGLLHLNDRRQDRFTSETIRFFETLAASFSIAVKRKQAEESLHREHERLKRVLEAETVGVMFWDLSSGCLVDANDTFLRLMGYSRRDVDERSLTWQKLTPPEYLEVSRAEIRKFQATGRVGPYEKEYFCKDGTRRWLVFAGSSLGPNACVEFCVDISDRKRLEQEYQAALVKYQTLFETLPTGVIILDSAGHIVESNRSAEALLGLSAAEHHAGRSEASPWPILRGDGSPMPPEELAAARALRGQCLVENVEMGLVKSPTETVWMNATAAPVAVPGLGAVSCFSDITQRKRAEAERTRLIAAVEQAAETIVITDVAGTILYANPALEKITGYSQPEALGQNPRILKSGYHDAAFYRQMWETLLRGEVWHGRLINRRKDGTRYEEEATISPVRDATGQIVNFVAVKRDVTEQVALEAQLRQAQKMEALGTLAGGVAHEINNPVFGIKNYAQLIADELPPDAPLGKFAAGIIKETDRVTAIVRNLLAFARIEKLGRSPANLSDIVQSTLTLLQSTIRHDQITLTVEVPEGLPPIACRSQQLEQVLLNLLTNARDAVNEKYAGYHADKLIRISVGLFEQDGQPWARVTVEDHGPGIPTEVRERIFDPFFSTKPTGKGTGLGLSISDSIMKEHGGHLRVEAEPGGSTRFHMELPVAPTSAAEGGV